MTNHFANPKSGDFTRFSVGDGIFQRSVVGVLEPPSSWCHGVLGIDWPLVIVTIEEIKTEAGEVRA